jgi:uncharacterized protein YbbC (DUF1343 family)
VASLLNARRVAGVHFVVDSFTPQSPGDGKYGGRLIPGVHVVVDDRDKVQSGRLGAAILWAVARASGDSLQIRARSFDERFGSTTAREAIVRGEDPDVVMDRQREAVARFLTHARPFQMYH